MHDSRQIGMGRFEFNQAVFERLAIVWLAGFDAMEGLNDLGGGCFELTARRVVSRFERADFGDQFVEKRLQAIGALGHFGFPAGVQLETTKSHYPQRGRGRQTTGAVRGRLTRRLRRLLVAKGSVVHRVADARPELKLLVDTL